MNDSEDASKTILNSNFGNVLKIEISHVTQCIKCPCLKSILHNPQFYRESSLE